MLKRSNTLLQQEREARRRTPNLRPAHRKSGARVCAVRVSRTQQQNDRHQNRKAEPAFILHSVEEEQAYARACVFEVARISRLTKVYYGSVRCTLTSARRQCAVSDCSSTELPTPRPRTKGAACSQLQSPLASRAEAAWLANGSGSGTACATMALGRRWQRWRHYRPVCCLSRGHYQG